MEAIENFLQLFKVAKKNIPGGYQRFIPVHYSKTLNNFSILFYCLQ